MKHRFDAKAHGFVSFHSTWDVRGMHFILEYTDH
jgi:hypothetical protein